LDAWVGTTIKINPDQLQGAQGLRIGIYPKRSSRDVPRKDTDLNLIRLPLPYDDQFMEVFYKSFFLVRAFLRADACIPKPVDLPDAEDRLLTDQLAGRKEFPILEVVEALARMAQQDLIEASDIEDKPINVALSEDAGLQAELPLGDMPDSVSVTPVPKETNV
jgi:hypothetical protein